MNITRIGQPSDVGLISCNTIVYARRTKPRNFELVYTEWQWRHSVYYCLLQMTRSPSLLVSLYRVLRWLSSPCCFTATKLRQTGNLTDNFGNSFMICWKLGFRKVLHARFNYLVTIWMTRYYMSLTLDSIIMFFMLSSCVSCCVEFGKVWTSINQYFIVRPKVDERTGQLSLPRNNYKRKK